MASSSARATGRWARNYERKRPLNDDELLKALENSDIEDFDDDSVADEDFQPNYTDLESSEGEEEPSSPKQKGIKKDARDECVLNEELENEGLEPTLDERNENGNTENAEEALNDEEFHEEASSSKDPETINNTSGHNKNKANVRVKGKRRIQQPKRPPLKWGKWKLTPQFPQYKSIEYDVGERHNWSPIDYFSNYYDRQFFVLLASQTNIHYLQQRGRLLNTDVIEMRKYVGIALAMSALGFPRIAMYWQANFKVPLISTNMNRDRFFTLRNFLHLVNNLDVTKEERDADKIWKVRPLLDRFRSVVVTLPREENMCIDEQMIPFAGAVCIRQYVPRKPNPTGIKIFILAGSSGQVLDFEVYQGATTKLPPEVDGSLKLGAGGRAIIRLAETCQPGSNLYFDRYFTGTALLEKLMEKGISGTGTIMANRFPNVGLKSDAILKQDGRGSNDFKVREDKKIALVKWMDNRSVVLASTKHNPTCGGTARRYSKPDKAYIEIYRPEMIGIYNVNMGGVDLLNRLIACYRSYHRTKKWPVRMFEHFMDMTVVNCWIQYCRDCTSINKPKREVFDLLSFKLRIAECLILGSVIMVANAEDESSDGNGDNGEAEAVPPRKKSKGRPAVVALPPQERRKFGAVHLPLAVDLPSAPRCRNPKCKHRSRVKCISCNAFFCTTKERNCFREFHS